MEINVETEKIDILRKQIFGRRIGCVGIKNIRVHRASDPNKMLNKLGHAAHTQPARHRARDLVTDQITEHGRVTGISPDGVADHPRNFIAHLFLAQKFDVLFPRQRNQNPDPGRQTFFQEPVRRRMVNPNGIDTDLAHHAKIDIDLFGPAKSVPVCVRFERPVGGPLDEKFPIAFEKEFRNGADPRVC